MVGRDAGVGWGRDAGEARETLCEGPGREGRGRPRVSVRFKASLGREQTRSWGPKWTFVDPGTAEEAGGGMCTLHPSEKAQSKHTLHEDGVSCQRSPGEWARGSPQVSLGTPMPDDSHCPTWVGASQQQTSCVDVHPGVQAEDRSPGARRMAQPGQKGGGVGGSQGAGAQGPGTQGGRGWGGLSP